MGRQHKKKSFSNSSSRIGSRGKVMLYKKQWWSKNDVSFQNFQVERHYKPLKVDPLFNYFQKTSLGVTWGLKVINRHSFIHNLSGKAG